jgi:hypothetical protein
VETSNDIAKINGNSKEIYTNMEGAKNIPIVLSRNELMLKNTLMISDIVTW